MHRRDRLVSIPFLYGMLDRCCYRRLTWSLFPYIQKGWVTSLCTQMKGPVRHEHQAISGVRLPCFYGKEGEVELYVTRACLVYSLGAIPNLPPLATKFIKTSNIRSSKKKTITASAVVAPSWVLKVKIFSCVLKVQYSARHGPPSPQHGISMTSAKPGNLPAGA